MPRHNGTMTCLLGRSGPWEFQVITPRHGLLLCGSEQKCAGDVEDSGSEPEAGGSQWKLWKSSGSGGRHVGDKERVEGVREVRKAVGKCGRGRKAWEVTVHYSDTAILTALEAPWRIMLSFFKINHPTHAIYF